MREFDILDFSDILIMGVFLIESVINFKRIIFI